MSKELEVLRVIEESYLHGTAGEYREKLRKDILVLEKALTPPTADEVCEALEEETGKRVKYKEDNQAFIEFDSQKYILLPSDVGIVFGITVHYRLHAKTLIMIGSFYEGDEE